MGNRPLFDCRHPSLPRLLAIPARSRCAARHLSSTRGPPRPDARKTGRTESARRRKEIWLAGSGGIEAEARAAAGLPFHFGDGMPLPLVDCLNDGRTPHPLSNGRLGLRTKGASSPMIGLTTFWAIRS